MTTPARLSEIASIYEDLPAGAVRPIVRPEPLLRPTRLAYLRFAKPDLAVQAQFLQDFGFSLLETTPDQLHARGSGTEPFIYHAVHGSKSRFVALGVVVDTEADLALAAAQPGASPIETEKGPGGGRRVTLRDPNGFQVEFIHGRTPAPPLADSTPTPRWNTLHGASRVNAGARPPLEPAQVRKLGHIVLQCMDFDATLTWWMQHVGLMVSDGQVLSDGSVNLAFCRLDRGPIPTDHHAVAIVGGVGPFYMHSAWEVRDADAVGQGQQALRAGGWKHGWGLGRHYYGSQIFDYWRDPFGHLMEHYTDGDLMDASVPTRYSRFTRGSTWMWGQDQPKDFETLAPEALWSLLKNLLTGRIKARRIGQILKALKQRPRPWMT